MEDSGGAEPFAPASALPPSSQAPSLLGINRSDQGPVSTSSLALANATTAPQSTLATSSTSNGSLSASRAKMHAPRGSKPSLTSAERTQLDQIVARMELRLTMSTSKYQTVFRGTPRHSPEPFDLWDEFSDAVITGTFLDEAYQDVPLTEPGWWFVLHPTSPTSPVTTPQDSVSSPSFSVEQMMQFMHIRYEKDPNASAMRRRLPRGPPLQGTIGCSLVFRQVELPTYLNVPPPSPLKASHDDIQENNARQLQMASISPPYPPNLSLHTTDSSNSVNQPSTMDNASSLAAGQIEDLIMAKSYQDYGAMYESDSDIGDPAGKSSSTSGKKQKTPHYATSKLSWSSVLRHDLQHPPFLIYEYLPKQYRIKLNPQMSNLKKRRTTRDGGRWSSKSIRTVFHVDRSLADEPTTDNLLVLFKDSIIEGIVLYVPFKSLPDEFKAIGERVATGLTEYHKQKPTKFAADPLTHFINSNAPAIHRMSDKEDEWKDEDFMDEALYPEQMTRSELKATLRELYDVSQFVGVSTVQLRKNLRELAGLEPDAQDEMDLPNKFKGWAQPGLDDDIQLSSGDELDGESESEDSEDDNGTPRPKKKQKRKKKPQPPPMDVDPINDAEALLLEERVGHFLRPRRQSKALLAEHFDILLSDEDSHMDDDTQRNGLSASVRNIDGQYSPRGGRSNATSNIAEPEADLKPSMDQDTSMQDDSSVSASTQRRESAKHANGRAGKHHKSVFRNYASPTKLKKDRRSDSEDDEETMLALKRPRRNASRRYAADDDDEDYRPTPGTRRSVSQMEPTAGPRTASPSAAQKRPKLSEASPENEIQVQLSSVAANALPSSNDWLSRTSRTSSMDVDPEAPPFLGNNPIVAHTFPVDQLIPNQTARKSARLSSRTSPYDSSRGSAAMNANSEPANGELPMHGANSDATLRALLGLANNQNQMEVDPSSTSSQRQKSRSAPHSADVSPTATPPPTHPLLQPLPLSYAANLPLALAVASSMPNTMGIQNLPGMVPGQADLLALLQQQQLAAAALQSVPLSLDPGAAQYAAALQQAALLQLPALSFFGAPHLGLVPGMLTPQSLSPVPLPKLASPLPYVISSPAPTASVTELDSSEDASSADGGPNTETPASS